MTYAKAAEKALIDEAYKLLAPDFIVRDEVTGKHWTGTRVTIDLAIYPLPHTIARGFPAVWLGIEAKVIDLAQQQYMARISGLLPWLNTITGRSASQRACMYGCRRAGDGWWGSLDQRTRGREVVSQ